MHMKLHIAMQEVAKEGRYIAQETRASEQGPSVTVSVRGNPHTMTVYEVSRMEVPEFAALWTVSTPLHACLHICMHCMAHTVS